MPVLDVALAMSVCGGSGGEDAASRVAVLNLKEKAISRVDSSFASAYTSLTKLDLSDNVIESVDSVKALSSVASLKWLSLANNNLTGAALEPVYDGGSGGGRRGGGGKKGGRGGSGGEGGGGSMPNMRVLNVSGNRLESLQGVQGMKNLGALIANENAIESLEPCKGMTQLNTIVASSNQIEELGDELRECSLLTKFSVSNNRIRKIGTALSGCAALKELRMAHNRLKALPPKLSANENLRILDLSHNRFENWGDVAVLSSLTRLQQLSLRGCALAEDPGYAATVMKMCPGLRALDGRKVGYGGWTDGDHSTRVKDDVEVVAVKEKGWISKAKSRVDAEEQSKDDCDDSDQDEVRSEEEEEEGAPKVTAKKKERRRDQEVKDNIYGKHSKRQNKDENTKGDGPEINGERESRRPRGEAGAEGTSFLQELVARNKGKIRSEEGNEGDKKKQRTGVVKVVENVPGGARLNGAVFGRDALLEAAGMGLGLGWDGVGWDDREAGAHSQKKAKLEEKTPLKKKVSKKFSDGGRAGTYSPKGKKKR